MFASAAASSGPSISASTAVSSGASAGCHVRVTKSPRGPSCSIPAGSLCDADAGGAGAGSRRGRARPEQHRALRGRGARHGHGNGSTGGGGIVPPVGYRERRRRGAPERRRGRPRRSAKPTAVAAHRGDVPVDVARWASDARLIKPRLESRQQRLGTKKRKCRRRRRRRHFRRGKNEPRKSRILWNGSFHQRFVWLLRANHSQDMGHKSGSLTRGSTVYFNSGLFYNLNVVPGHFT